MKKFNLLAFIALFISSFSLTAQFDDLYSDDVSDYEVYADSDDYTDYDDYDSDDYFDEDYEDYEYWSEYDDNYYTNRVRRNRRGGSARLIWLNSWAPNSFYNDPFAFYTPYNSFYRGGSFVTINIGSPYLGWGNPYRNVRRAWNPWNSYYNYYSPYGNTYGSSAGGFGSRTGRSFGSRVGNGCVGYGGRSFTRVNTRSTTPQATNPKGSYYGTRRTGSTAGSVRNNRVSTVRTSPRKRVETNKATTVTRRTTSRKSTSKPNSRRSSRTIDRNTSRSSRSSYKTNNTRSSNRSTRPSTRKSSRNAFESMRSSSRTKTMSTPSRSTSTRSTRSSSGSSRSSLRRP